MRAFLKPAILFLFASQTLLACTDRALVYGERTGLNLAVRADPAQGSPLEVNTGFQRRVVGFVPPSGYSSGGRPQGEAVNMFSRFDLQRGEGNDGNFNDTISIRTSFASGAAAKNIAGNESAVAAIVDAPVFRQPSSPQDATISRKLLAFTRTEANALEYLTLANSLQMNVVADPNPIVSALKTIGQSGNTAGNRQIAGFLNL